MHYCVLRLRKKTFLRHFCIFFWRVPHPICAVFFIYLLLFLPVTFSFAMLARRNDETFSELNPFFIRIQNPAHWQSRRRRSGAAAASFVLEPKLPLLSACMRPIWCVWRMMRPRRKSDPPPFLFFVLVIISLGTHAFFYIVILFASFHFFFSAFFTIAVFFFFSFPYFYGMLGVILQ